MTMAIPQSYEWMMGGYTCRFCGCPQHHHRLKWDRMVVHRATTREDLGHVDLSRVKIGRPNGALRAAVREYLSDLDGQDDMAIYEVQCFTCHPRHRPNAKPPGNRTTCYRRTYGRGEYIG